MGAELYQLPGVLQRPPPAGPDNRANLAFVPLQASSLERQSPGVASCLTHSLCPGEPSLQTAAGTLPCPAPPLPTATRASVVGREHISLSWAELDTVHWLSESKDVCVGRVAETLSSSVGAGQPRRGPEGLHRGVAHWPGKHLSQGRKTGLFGARWALFPGALHPLPPSWPPAAPPPVCGTGGGRRPAAAFAAPWPGWMEPSPFHFVFVFFKYD